MVGHPVRSRGLSDEVRKIGITLKSPYPPVLPDAHSPPPPFPMAGGLSPSPSFFLDDEMWGRRPLFLLASCFCAAAAGFFYLAGASSLLSDLDMPAPPQGFIEGGW